jgi:hypothetical protein
MTPVVISVAPAMLEYAIQLAAGRRKPDSVTREVIADPDIVGLVGELAFYEWRYGTWQVARRKLEFEIERGYVVGGHDGGEDDIGIDVKTSLLPPHRQLHRQHLLISADPEHTKQEFQPHIRYVPAFWRPHADEVIFPGYIGGTGVLHYCPKPYRFVPHGLIAYVVPVAVLRNLRDLPHTPRAV